MEIRPCQIGFIAQHPVGTTSKQANKKWAGFTTAYFLSPPKPQFHSILSPYGIDQFTGSQPRLWRAATA